VKPNVAERVRFAHTRAIREEIADVIPLYRGIERLRERGDQFQYGGARLGEGWQFPTADGRARFSAVPLPNPVADDGRLMLSTRRGKQFNSMVQERSDALTGATREAVLLNAHDAQRLRISDGAPVLVRSDAGELRGRAHFAPIAPGNVQVHWPEGNVLIGSGRRSPQAGIPDYNARVSVEPLPDGASRAPEARALAQGPRAS
jgi:anaerobic selenocysteine-containing dehydrogenase